MNLQWTLINLTFNSVSQISIKLNYKSFVIWGLYYKSIFVIWGLYLRHSSIYLYNLRLNMYLCGKAYMASTDFHNAIQYLLIIVYGWKWPHPFRRNRPPGSPTSRHLFNSSPPIVPYMCVVIISWTGSALVQVMACRLFGAKPLPEPMLEYCQLDP